MAGGDVLPEYATEPEQSFTGEFRRRARVGDALAIVAVPAVLVIAFLLPDETASGLVLSHADPTPAATLTAHYVHLEAGHLLGNLSVYALVVPVAYLLCLFADRRREFFVAFVTYVLALPPVLSVLDLALLEDGVLLGFSGVLMAFVGFLPVAIVWYAQVVADVDLHLDHAPGLFFLGLAAVALWTVPVTSLQLVLAGAAGLAGLAYALSARSALDGIASRWTGAGGYPELGGAGLVAFAFGVAVGFPTGPVTDGVVVNYYGHLLGYAIGFIAAYVTFRLDIQIR